MTLRRGARVSLISIVWTLLVNSTAVVLGITNSSLVLVAFGLTGLLDAAGSIALFVNFRHAMKHEAISEKHERIAFVLVTVGLVAVALSTIALGVDRLVSGAKPSYSTLGLFIAGASVVVLSILARVKTKLGSEIPSQALFADGLLSLTGALLATVTLVGSVLVEHNVLWADPAAAIVVAVGALGFAIGLHLGDRKERTTLEI